MISVYCASVLPYEHVLFCFFYETAFNQIAKTNQMACCICSPSPLLQSHHQLISTLLRSLKLVCTLTFKDGVLLNSVRVLLSLILPSTGINLLFTNKKILKHELQ